MAEVNNLQSNYVIFLNINLSFSVMLESRFLPQQKSVRGLLHIFGVRVTFYFLRLHHKVVLKAPLYVIPWSLLLLYKCASFPQFFSKSFNNHPVPRFILFHYPRVNSSTNLNRIEANLGGPPKLWNSGKFEEKEDVLIPNIHTWLHT